MEHYQEAINDFMKVLELQPNVPDAYIEMGNAKSSLGYHRESIKDQRQAMEINPAYEGLAYYNIACNHSLMMQKEEMFTYLRKAQQEGFFESDERFKHFLDDPDFDNYRDDEDFKAYIQKLRKQRKGFFERLF